MSSYKMEELLEMCNKLAIDIQDSNKKRKKDIYELIILNF